LHASASVFISLTSRASFCLLDQDDFAFRTGALNSALRT
jgi:hypothetical protein